jgi:hypothetical protein
MNHAHRFYRNELQSAYMALHKYSPQIVADLFNIHVCIVKQIPEAVKHATPDTLAKGILIEFETPEEEAADDSDSDDNVIEIYGHAITPEKLHEMLNDESIPKGMRMSPLWPKVKKTYKARVSADVVRNIRKAAHSGVLTQREIAARFGVSLSVAYNIISRKSYADIE